MTDQQNSGGNGQEPREHTPEMGDAAGSDGEMGRMYAAHNEIPDVPVEEMWRAVAAELPQAQETPGVIPMRRAKVVRAIGWAMAAGIVLLVGIGIGRSSTGTGPVAAAPDAEPTVGADAGRANGAVRRVALEQLADVEPLLTMIGADARAGRIDPEVQRWARQQLTRTRLALDSPIGQDPSIRDLLHDLELILAQVVTVEEGSSERTGEELMLIASGMTDQALLERIRTATVTGP